MSYHTQPYSSTTSFSTQQQQLAHLSNPASGHSRTGSNPVPARDSSFTSSLSSSTSPPSFSSNTPTPTNMLSNPSPYNGQNQGTNHGSRSSPYTHTQAAASNTSIASTAVSRSDLPPRGSSAQASHMDMSSFNYGNRSTTRARQNSQGFFEPSLPHATSQLTASQIAAQAAMHVQNPRAQITPQQQQQQYQAQIQQSQHDRRRSQTIPEQLPPISKTSAVSGAQNGFQGPQSKTKGGFFGPHPIQTGDSGRCSPQINQRRDPASAGAFKSTTAASAANAAYPSRSPLTSPSLQNLADYIQSPSSEREDRGPPMVTRLPGGAGKEKDKDKEKTKRKLFSKPSRIHISKDKEVDKKAVQTAGVYGSHSNFPSFNQSTSSLADLPSMPPPPSLYSNPNANSSASTLVPSDKAMGGDREKEKHRHHFLSRQKHKIKDDHHNLPLSSASSNSRPTDPAMPQPLYSFAPSSPGLGNKSISGLDLRHGGRALREKKKEEKAAASTFVPPLPTATPTLDSSTYRDRDHSITFERPTPQALPTAIGPTSGGGGLALASDLGIPPQGLTGFGLQGMGLDDAWPLLKARLLNIFEGEDLRTPVEDFNRLVSAHLQRNIQRRTPAIVVEDLVELLRTGCLSLDHTLRGIPEERIVPNLVETWSFVFGTILPFVQAVFLPLDLEFKGRGILPPNEASDFWAVVPGFHSTISRPDKTSISEGGKVTKGMQASSVPLDVRSLLLVTFRDTVVLPRHDTLLHIFSRLSLDSIHALPGPNPPFANLPSSASELRPGTAASSSSVPMAPDNNPSSFNSQASTLLDSSTADSLGARSRATSNTSAGSFHSAGSARVPIPTQATPNAKANAGPGLTVGMVGGPAGVNAPVLDSAQVTEIAARMLQCVSVLSRLGSSSSGEATEVEQSAQKKMENLGKELKLNWLGRGRTGRNRKGLVGTKVRSPIGVGA